MVSDALRTILVGDVHGCLDELTALLAKCGLAAGDRLVFVGDLVAKGPDSAGVVELAREHGALCVRGNHDEAVLRYLRAKHRGETLPKVKKAHLEVGDTLSRKAFAYLEATPFYLELRDAQVWVVHAGVVPGLSLSKQDPRHLMTMRTLKPDGTPSQRLDEGTPWAERYTGPTHVIFGHDAMSGLQQHPFATGLDTGCVYGGKLSALLLPERRLVQVDARRAYQEIDA